MVVHWICRAGTRRTQTESPMSSFTGIFAKPF